MGPQTLLHVLRRNDYVMKPAADFSQNVEDLKHHDTVGQSYISFIHDSQGEQSMLGVPTTTYGHNYMLHTPANSNCAPVRLASFQQVQAINF